MALNLNEVVIFLSDYGLGVCHPLGQGSLGSSERG